MLNPVASQVSFAALEAQILEKWELEGTFERRRALNSGNEPFSFIDGPMTANNPMGVHHAWGRTYKDMFQRFRAMQGYDQRYQNGFDCQGLWVEVEVEKELGLNSKRDIVEYGLGPFAERCRERVLKYAAVQTEQSKSLGQWMDWGHSYYTMADSNIEHIWHFLKESHGRGWLYRGHRVMPWCCRCGTSLSQHELTDSYRDLRHMSLFARFRLLHGPLGAPSSLLVWTTTPWTLPANTGVAVHPDLMYLLVSAPEGQVWVGEGSPAAASLVSAGSPVLGRVLGSALVGLEYVAPFEDMAVPGAVAEARRVVAWSAVSALEGSGLVHIAPGCGAEDYALGQEQGLGVLCPIDDFGRFLPGYGHLAGLDVRAAGKVVLRDLRAAGLLAKEEPLEHRYPVCWRCGEELVFRLADEWFLSSAEVREPMREAAAGVRWIPEHAGKRMDDWLTNMGDWCISRKRFWGMPLPFYQCAECGRLTVVGSVSELRSLAQTPSSLGPDLDLHRPGIDEIRISCPGCGNAVRRAEEVGDCWLDAGIVPFSTLDYLGTRPSSPAVAGAGMGAGTGTGPWNHWFPADFVCEMREQIRLWFYSMLFVSVTLTGKAPYRTVMVHEKVHDEKGRPMHKSSGNAIWFDDAVARMGADTMRWLYASRNPSLNLNFGFGEAAKVRAKLLTLWNVYSFLTTYAALDAWAPSHMGDGGLCGHSASACPAATSSGAARREPLDIVPTKACGGVPQPSALLDSWLVARTQAMATACCERLAEYEAADYVSELDSFVDDLSNWYVRRNRRRFWKAGSDADKTAGYRTLHWALLTFCRAAAPLIPFVTEAMWANLSQGTGLPPSVHLAAYPRGVGQRDTAAAQELEAMARVRTVVNLGLSARNAAGIRVRQPLRLLTVLLPAECQWPDGADAIVAEELNVKGVVVERGSGLEPEVQLDTALDDELVWEGVARDMVRHVQALRREQGLAVDDSIGLDVVVAGGGGPWLEGHMPYVASETLASACTLTSGDPGETGWHQVRCGEISVALRVERR